MTSDVCLAAQDHPPTRFSTPPPHNRLAIIPAVNHHFKNTPTPHHPQPHNALAATALFTTLAGAAMAAPSDSCRAAASASPLFASSPFVASELLRPAAPAVVARDLGAGARGVPVKALRRSVSAATAAAAAWNAGSAAKDSGADRTADGDDCGRWDRRRRPGRGCAAEASRMMRRRGEGTPGHAM